MALLFFILLPLGWALTGWLAGVAVSLSAPTEAGSRFGARLGRCCTFLLPSVHVLLFLVGVSGNAGHGVRLFGSEELVALACLPIYLVPALGVYDVVVYVIRDLTRQYSKR
jgi:hypothetical protein